MHITSFFGSIYGPKSKDRIKVRPKHIIDVEIVVGLRNRLHSTYCWRQLVPLCLACHHTSDCCMIHMKSNEDERAVLSIPRGTYDSAVALVPAPLIRSTPFRCTPPIFVCPSACLVRLLVPAYLLFLLFRRLFDQGCRGCRQNKVVELEITGTADWDNGGHATRAAWVRGLFLDRYVPLTFFRQS